jgi:hypothetical protein
MTTVVTVTETSALILASSSAHSHSQYYTQAQVDALLVAAGASFIPPLEITVDDYQLLATQIGRTIRANPAFINNVYLPSGSVDLHGKNFYLLIEGAGTVTFTCSGTDKIGNSTGTILSIEGDPYAQVTIEWDNSVGAWVIHRTGGISVS